MYQVPSDQLISLPAMRQRWIILTFLAGMTAGLCGYLRFNALCSRICGDPMFGIFTVRPGYSKSLIAGSVVAGALAGILAIIAQAYILWPYIKRPLWIVGLLPISMLSVVGTVPIVTLGASRTDVVDELQEVLTIGTGIAAMSIAALLIGLGYSFALNVQKKGIWAWKTVQAWSGAWGIFGLAGLEGTRLVLVIGWTCCWLLLAWASGRSSLGLLQDASLEAEI